MTIACVIPARLNSSRFPGKLLAQAFGKTILQHTFEKAAKCSKIDHLYVATDNLEISDHVRSFGGNVIETSLDCQNGTERIYQAFLNTPELQKAKIIINLQADHPMTESLTLEKMVDVLENDLTTPMATAVSKLTSWDDYLSPHVVKCVFDQSGNALYFSRSPIPYHKEKINFQAYGHIGIYAYKTSFLRQLFTLNSSFLQKIEDLEQLKVLENGHRIKIAIVEETILGIDTPKDLEKFKELLCQSNISLSQVV